MYLNSYVTGFSDGPSEIHKTTLARRALKHYEPVTGLWPSEHLPSRREPAKAHVAELLAELDGRS